MSNPEDQERAARSLKRVNDLASGATKTAIISLGALAVVWFTQIRPEYERLRHHVYREFFVSYTQKVKKTRRVETIREAEIKRADRRAVAQANIARHNLSPAPAAAGGAPPSSGGAGEEAAGEQSQNAGENDAPRKAPAEKAPEEKSAGGKIIDELGKGISENEAQQKRLVESVPFDVFGLKLPVPPLYASVVWNLLLLAVLVYLARARYAIWTLCSEALLSLKRLGRNAESLNDVAGAGPVWLAPPPSGAGAGCDVTAAELRSAFGWNRLQTLPSIAATAGLLLLALLQLSVTAQGFKVIEASRAFTEAMIKVGTPGGRIDDAAERLDQIRVSEPKIANLMISSAEASLLSVLLLATLVGTVILVVWWFRPWSVPLPGEAKNPSRPARALLAALVLVAACSAVGWLRPDWGARAGGLVARVLPNLTGLVAGCAVAFCLVELAMLALTSAPGAKVKGEKSGL